MSGAYNPSGNPIRTGVTPTPVEALGQSEVFLAFQESLSRVAGVDRPVLLLGERGTGKELAATRLHYLSHRWQGPLVALNCAALSPSLIESELFGFERGAFTGATRRSSGRFESADGGTLFLDEIGNIPVEAQEKILRVVEYGTFERVGSSASIHVDARIIAATNADLKAITAEKRFKQDLLDRLSFEVLYLPPLRERKEDILYLCRHFAARMAFELRREEIPEFSLAAVEALESHSWPGNIRELKNVIERAVYRSKTRMISEIDFDPLRSPYGGKAELPKDERFQGEVLKTGESDLDLMELPLGEAVRQLQLRMLKKALKESRFNQKNAARRLGLSYDQFRGVYRKFKDQL